MSSLGVSFIRTLIPSLFSKTSPSNTITLGGQDSTYEFGGGTNIQPIATSLPLRQVGRRNRYRGMLTFPPKELRLPAETKWSGHYWEELSPMGFCNVHIQGHQLIGVY